MNTHTHKRARAAPLSFERSVWLPAIAVAAAVAALAGFGFARAQSYSPYPGTGASTQNSTDQNQTSPVPASNPSSAATPSPSPAASSAATTTAGATLAPLPMPGMTPAPIVVSIDTDGNALLRGVVTSVASDTLTVRSWGGMWTIHSGGPGSTTAVPAGIGDADDFSAITIGDFVGAEGIADLNASWTVNASFVRDWTTNPLSGFSASPSTTTVVPQTPPTSSSIH